METIAEDLALETLAVDSANHAAPAPAAESATRDLRRDLERRIADRRAADIRAAAALQISNRADDARREAEMTVEQIRREIHAAQRDAIEAHAEACAAAFRTGEPLPHAPIPPEGDSPALAAAVARLDALDRAAGQLAAEATEARGEAAAATVACRALVDSIIIADARAIAREWVATIRLGWELQDRLTGLARIGDGSLLPHADQTQILDQINRRTAAIADNGLMLERHHYDAHLDRLAAGQERAWLDYGRRLMDDPAAAFGEGLPQ
jgi:hypothetical protein